MNGGVRARSCAAQPPSDRKTPCLENPRPKGGILTNGERRRAEYSLTENAASPFQAEPRADGEVPSAIISLTSFWARVRAQHPQVFIIAVLVTAVAIGLIFAFSRRSVTAQPQITSIAVLPLANLSAGPEEFFADGMTEELITNLAKIKALSVIARTAVMRYRRTNKGPDEIARELGVQALVEGSVQRVGGRVRVTVRLIEPHNFTELWAENYERDAGDVLAMESEIARDIARTVHSRPTNDETELLVNSPSLDPHAMENYLESLQYVGGGLGPDAPRRALALLDKVIQREPRFAQAYATQAQIYYVLGSENFWAPGSDHNVVLPAAVAFTKGEEAALNPSLASAHSQVALLLAALDRRVTAKKYRKDCGRRRWKKGSV